MPRIPTSNERQVKEQISQGKGFQSRLGDTTRRVNLAANTAGAVAQVGKIIEREQIKAEETQATEYKLKLRNKKIELTHDKDKGFFKERGKNAALNEKTYSEEFKKYGDSTMEEYAGASDRLKAKLSLINQGFQTDLKAQYSSHTARQNEIYETEMFSAEMESLHSEAVLDNSKIGSAIEQQRNLIYGRKDKNGKPLMANGVPVQPGIAAQKGFSKEKADQMFLKSTTSLHTDVLVKMMDNGQDKLANDYFQVALKNNEISGEAAAGLEKALKQSSLTGESQRISEDIIVEGLGLEASKAKARETIDDPALQDLTVKRIDSRIKEMRAEKEFNDRKYYEDIGDQVFKDPENFKLTAEMNKNLTFSQQKSLISLQQSMKMESRGVKKTSNMKVYSKIASMSHDDLVKYDLLKHEKDLTPSDLKAFIKAKANANDFTNITNTSKYVTDLIKSQNLDDDIELSNSLRQQFETEINRYPQEERQKLETMNKVRNQLMLEMEIPWSFSDEPYYKVKAQGLKTDGPDKTRF